MRFSVYQESHIGARKINQDRMGYCFTRDSLLLLLADGMGGHILGEMAATIAMQTISNLFQQQADPYIPRPERFFEESFLAAHKEIQRYRVLNNLPETPRTTIVACLIQHNVGFWAHCGDSRLYWIRNGQLLLRTRDHSRLENMIAQGEVSPTARETHPDRNKLYNCLGAHTDPIVDISRRASLHAGDLILLCSDGLWSALPEYTLLQSLRERTIVRAVPELLARAVAASGKNADNVTALAMMYEGGDENPSTVATNMLSLGAISSTVHTSPTAQSGKTHEENADEFDDSQIEKAIKEIRDAIQKTPKAGVKS